MIDTAGFEFDYGLGAGASSYDPLEAHDDDADELEDGAEEWCPDAPSAIAPVRKPIAHEEDLAPASERIATLFERFQTRRRVLVGILRYTQERRSALDLRAEVDRLQEHDFSVYSAVNYSMLLHKAGALAKVEEDGTPFEDKLVRDPEIVEVDGERFYRPLGYRKVFWEITEDGRSALQNEESPDRVRKLLEDDSRYLPIYQRILEAGLVRDGASMPELNALVNDDPLVQNPRYYASRFLNRLEQCDAMVWEGAWKTTAIGEAAIERAGALCAAVQEGE